MRRVSNLAFGKVLPVIGSASSSAWSSGCVMIEAPTAVATNPKVPTVVEESSRSAAFSTKSAVPSAATLLSTSTVTAFHQYRFLHVESNATPNPECLRFFSMELSFLPPGTAMDLPNEGHAYKSPLAEHLFSLQGVKQLYFADEYITVTKEETADWGVLTPMVKEMINSFAESGENILAPEMSNDFLSTDNDTDPEEGDDEVVLAVKELLHTRIRPMLKSDGGNVKYVGIEEGSVYVLLEGACKTCPSSSVTLKTGIERMLMHWIPEVAEVLEVDDDFAYDFKQRAESLKKQEAAGAAGVQAPEEGSTAGSEEKKEAA